MDVFTFRFPNIQKSGGEQSREIIVPVPQSRFLNNPDTKKLYSFLFDVYNDDAKLASDLEKYEVSERIRDGFPLGRLISVLANRVNLIEDKMNNLDTMIKNMDEIKKQLNELLLEQNKSNSRIELERGHSGIELERGHSGIELERGSSGLWDGGKKYQSRKTRKQRHYNKKTRKQQK
jgi:hypothetical protein